MTEPTTETPAAPITEQPAPEQPTPNTGDATGTNGGSDEKMVPQSRVDEIVKERLDRERKQADAKAAKAAEEAEALKLKEQAQWQKLAEDKEAKVKELEPQVETLTAERDQLQEIVSQIIDTETKDWPKEVKDLLPAEADVLTRYAAVARTRPLAAKLSQAAPPAGNSPNPKPNGAAGNAQEGRERVAAFYRGRI